MRTKALILSILVCAISISTQGQEVMDKVVTLQEVFHLQIKRQITILLQNLTTTAR